MLEKREGSAIWGAGEEVQRTQSQSVGLADAWTPRNCDTLLAEACLPKFPELR